MRERLQNGVDAVTLRQKEQPGWSGGKFTIFLTPGRRMVFRDYGEALLAGGHPLRGGELKTLNQELLNMIDHSAR
ncbi:hypothetical protein [uncultured Oscillibacter sp.]|uniref:hypothetical protein n=1 Tax=uncultured Oscillibacter sp. TaxID=876091 RepID=UPI0025EEE970|nr:hypothetical protein [uncultured Oscillibacter sp.]